MTFKKSKILHIFIIHLNFVAVQSFSHVQLFVTLWARACQDSLFFTISWSLLKLMSIESVMPSNLILCHPLLLLPSIFPRIRLFSNESALHIRRPNYWNFSLNISASSEYSGLISFRIDWFDLLAVQETRESLLQHHNSKASIILEKRIILQSSLVVFNHFNYYFQNESVSCSALSDAVTPWTVAHQDPLSMGFSQARILE